MCILFYDRQQQQPEYYIKIVQTNNKDKSMSRLYAGALITDTKSERDRVEERKM